MSAVVKVLRRLDFKDANYSSAFFHLFSAAFACVALISNDWIVIDNYNQNSTAEYEFNKLLQRFDSASEECTSIGCRDFWKPARFGGFVDSSGQSHIAFHTDGRVLVDCITPSVANLFYILIALCFVISMTSSFCCSMNLIPPPAGFFLWLRTNSIMEMSNMMLVLCACVTAIIAQSEVAAQRPDDEVSIGSGVFMVCISGLLCFLASMASIRHSAKMNRMRRLDNQRLLCARTLRSWRDAGRRPSDTRPIVDFERYLDECSTEMTSTEHQNPAV